MPVASRPSRSSRAAIVASTVRRHRLERRQRLVAVAVLVEVDLRHRLQPELAPRVDQHRDLDAVAGRERQPLEQLAPRRHLARERLAHARELAGRTAPAPGAPSGG